MPTEALETIDVDELSRVSGGASSNDQITAALTQITNSLSQLSANRNQQDPTQMLLLMMMMGGMGGGGGGGYAAPPPVAAQPTYVEVSATGGRCGRGGKKGW